jgi:ATP-binding cassette subfamily F protein 3
VNFTVDRGDRIAFVGVNGAGKSTLARIIAGVEPFDGGERIPGHNVSISYFAQHQAEELNPGFDVLQTVDEVATGDIRRRLRSLLGSFLFTGDDVFKKVQVLSGGEKSRLALAKMLLLPANLVVLDEPTNHLDMRSKAVLQEALLAFDGSLIVVSHDRDFLDPLVTSVVEFKNGGLRSYPGNVSEYLEARSRMQERSREPVAAQASTPLQERDRKRREAELRQERYGKTKPLLDRLHAVEESIRTEEDRKAELERHMTDPGLYREPERIREINAAYRDIGPILQALYEEWASVSEELENVNARYEAARGGL